MDVLLLTFYCSSKFTVHFDDWILNVDFGSGTRRGRSEASYGSIRDSRGERYSIIKELPIGIDLKIEFIVSYG